MTVFIRSFSSWGNCAHLNSWLTLQTLSLSCQLIFLMSGSDRLFWFSCWNMRHKEYRGILKSEDLSGFRGAASQIWTGDLILTKTPSSFLRSTHSCCLIPRHPLCCKGCRGAFLLSRTAPFYPVLDRFQGFVGRFVGRISGLCPLIGAIAPLILPISMVTIFS